MKKNFCFWFSLSLAMLNLQASPVWAGDPILGSTQTQQQPTTTAQNNSSTPSTSPSGPQTSGIMPAGPLGPTGVRTTSLTLSATEKKLLTNLKSLKFDAGQSDLEGPDLKLILTAQNTPKTIKIEFQNDPCAGLGDQCEAPTVIKSFYIHIRSDADSQTASIDLNKEIKDYYEISYNGTVEILLKKPQILLKKITESSLKPSQQYNSYGFLAFEKAVNGRILWLGESPVDAPIGAITNTDGSRNQYSLIGINPEPPSEGTKLIYTTRDREGKTLKIYGHLDKTTYADKSYDLHFSHQGVSLKFNSDQELIDIKVGSTLMSKILDSARKKLEDLRLGQNPITPELIQKAESILRGTRTQLAKMLDKVQEVLRQPLEKSSVEPFQINTLRSFDELRELVTKTRNDNTYKIGSLEANMPALDKALGEAMLETAGQPFEGFSAGDHDKYLKGVTATDVRGLLSHRTLRDAEALSPGFFVRLHGGFYDEAVTSADFALGESYKLISRLVKKFGTADPVVFKKKLLGQRT